MEPEKMDTAPLVKQEVDENSTVCNQVGAEIPSEVNEETAPSPTTGDEPPVNPWCVIKCVFCLQMLNSNDNPKLMECLHTACSSCVATKLNEQLDGEVIENNVVVCPVCRVHCHANNLIENQFLLEVSGSSSEANATDPSSDLKCTSCHENSPATSWCVECSEYICDGCVQ
ncbi:unnamed protein product, partial [Timema podura]|nr:unnamed protein product [Timema podura]